MYIDSNGQEHPFIHLIEEDTESYLKGWYFEDETNNFHSDEPIKTLEEAERLLKEYFTYLNRTKEPCKNCDSKCTVEQCLKRK